MMKSPRIIKKRIVRQCVVCGKDVKVIVYTDGKCRGGHYFGKIPLHTKKAWKEAIQVGTYKSKLMGRLINVMNKDPKPYKYAEYWECPKCYWRK